MKQFIMVCLTAVMLVSCGQDDSSPAAGGAKKEVKKQAIVKIKLPDGEKVFNDIEVRYDDMVKETSLSGGYVDQGGGFSQSTFLISFNGTSAGEAKDVSMTLKGYSIEDVSMHVDSIDAGESGGMMKRIKIHSIKGFFKGRACKTDEVGFSVGEAFEFSGTFEK